MKIAIAGRPNTGKSTLFNQLTRSRDAIVHNRPGVTRDVVSGMLRMAEDTDIELFDTAGLETKTDEIGKISTDKSLAAIKGADAVLFVVDGKAGLVPGDTEWTRIVKKAGKPVLLLVNKTEGKRTGDLSEFYKLGLGEPVPVSAEHKQGFDAISEFISKLEKPNQKSEIENQKSSDAIRVAIMGQPNVGKSTLVNKILGEDRVIVRDEPGVTRDTIAIKTKFLGRDMTIVDTAGLRRKAGITDDVETLAALKSLDAISKSDAVILIVDATKNIENQALGIAGRVYDAGKILAVALNKWDLVPEEIREDKLLKLKHQFADSFHQIIKPLILPISAEQGRGVKNMIKRVYELWDLSNEHAATSFVNRTLEKLMAARQPPMSRLKRPMKIKFASQTGKRPMRITVNVGGTSDIPESYTRYLRKGIAKALRWESLPVVIEYAKTENPYD
ncbi:MAG: ribosome biogenesis GTPase Der [Alphaproteobacteria bacterium]|nr:ribosome biogenesis GTPase Der [Alphaproteobacteria bacterium]